MSEREVDQLVFAILPGVLAENLLHVCCEPDEEGKCFTLCGSEVSDCDVVPNTRAWDNQPLCESCRSIAVPGTRSQSAPKKPPLGRESLVPRIFRPPEKTAQPKSLTGQRDLFDDFVWDGKKWVKP